MVNEDKLSKYSTHFDELSTEDHDLIIDLNAINPLSELRDEWQNATNTPSEHHLSTSANTDDLAYVKTEERGQYTAGFWGYFQKDPDTGEITNGFYFGADSTGVFVARADGGTIEKVYQNEWNRDKLDGESPLNASDSTLSVSDGLVFRIDFTYYGYGPIEMRVLMDDDDDDNYGNSKLVTAHTFHVKGSTSTDNTNLPIRVEIESNGTNNDALDLFLGGRQFSVVGKETSNTRLVGHYRDELAGVDDTAWYPAISFKLKDGTDNIGSGQDFGHVLGELRRFSADTDANAYRWQFRRGTQPDNPSWEVPSSHTSKPDETAFKVDTNSTSITDGSGNLTGVFIDGGTLAEGTKNVASIDDEEIDGQITNSQVVTLLFQAVPSASGTISEIFFKNAERW